MERSREVTSPTVFRSFEVHPSYLHPDTSRNPLLGHKSEGSQPAPLCWWKVASAGGDTSIVAKVHAAPELRKESVERQIHRKERRDVPYPRNLYMLRMIVVS